MSNYIEYVRWEISYLSIPILASLLVASSLAWLVARYSLGRRHFVVGAVLCNMFGLYGVALGLFMGSSKESIARDAIPLLATFFSGFFAYLISKDISPRLKSIVPIAVIGFILSLMFSLLFYAKVKDAERGSGVVKASNS